MESLYLLIPLSVVLVFVIGVVFWWSVRSGQFDDLEGPGYRVVIDDDNPPENLAKSPLEPAASLETKGSQGSKKNSEKIPH